MTASDNSHAFAIIGKQKASEVAKEAKDKNQNKGWFRKGWWGKNSQTSSSPKVADANEEAEEEDEKDEAVSKVSEENEQLERKEKTIVTKIEDTEEEKLDLET